MRAISILVKRELAAYVTSPLGWIIAAAALFIEGLVFHGQALGAGKLLSAEVLRLFFFNSSGVTVGVAVALSMRLLAEERASGTIVLLHTSPVRDVEIVVAKFLSAFIFLAAVTLASVYMPLLILKRGKIAFGQVAVGYAGLLLLGAAVTAIGLFASALARHQLVALVVSIAIVGAFYLLWPLSQVLDPPLKDVAASLSIYVRHFHPFTIGTLHLRDVVYYLAITYFFLLLAVKTMEAKRWQ